MKEETLFELLGEADLRKVAAAATMPKRNPPRLARLRRGAMAACFAAALLAAFSLLLHPLHPQGEATPEGPGGTEVGVPAGSGEETQIRLDALYFNELLDASSVDSAPTRLPLRYDTDVVWGKAEVAAYYGRDLTPPYIPDGLKAAPGNSTARVVLDENGAVVVDAVSLGFYHDYNADGSPKLTEVVPEEKGFSVLVSKLGRLNCGVYLLPENEVKTSRIGETEVTFGYRSMPYGPYDPDTHAPSGFYDLYVAQFEFDGAEYQIVAKQMEALDVVKVVASILCEGKVTVIP